MQIEFNKVNYSYPNAIKTALENISFNTSSGEFIALIGASGSGKSTLCRLLLGLCEQQEGTIFLNGSVKTANKLFPSVGMVFQYPEQQLFAENVFEEIAFALKCHDVPQEQHKELVDKALKEVGLNPAAFCERNPFMLSGGEKRRVAIASVLVMRPQLLIFDEPSAGLDLRGRAFIAELAKKQNAMGVTVLWVTHNMEEAAELASKVLVLNKGKLLACGSVNEVFQNDEILEAGLDLPEAARLMRALKEKKVPIKGDSVRLEDAFNEIYEWKRGGAPSHE